MRTLMTTVLRLRGLLLLALLGLITVFVGGCPCPPIVLYGMPPL